MRRKLPMILDDKRQLRKPKYEKEIREGYTYFEKKLILLHMNSLL